MSAVTPARAVAYSVLRRTFEGEAHTEAAFRSEAAAAGLERRERAQAQHLAFGAVQRRGTTDALVSRFSGKGRRRPPPEAMAALRLGMFELLFSGGSAEHAAVDQAVSLAREAGAHHAAGFVNALLRRTLRERGPLLEELADDSTPAHASFAHSVPPWLAEMWWRELGEERARSLIASVNRPTERALRVNPERLSPEEAVARLAGPGLEVVPAEGEWPLAPPELLIARGSLAAAEPLSEEGLVVPQSRGSAAVVEVLDPQPGDRVLDLCAGPGVKTGQLAARAGPRSEVVSVEPDEERAAEIARQMERQHVRWVTVFEADATAAAMPREFERVLVDAPCSDLGALSSRPDARWRKTPKTVERLAELQHRILLRAAEALAPGGTLVYATCTVSARENHLQVERLLGETGLVADDLGAVRPDLADASDSRFLQLLPDRDRTTGFFIARLRSG